MTQAGPSDSTKQKKKTKAPVVKSRKIKKLSETKAIVELEQAALAFVSIGNRSNGHCAHD